VDVAAVFGDQPAQIKKFALEARLVLEDAARDRDEPPTLGAFARARVLAAGGALAQQTA
jgi:hypothetical protein